MCAPVGTVVCDPWNIHIYSALLMSAEGVTFLMYITPGGHPFLKLWGQHILSGKSTFIYELWEADEESSDESVCII